MNQTSQLPAYLQRLNQWLRMFFTCLLGLNLVLLACNLPDFLRGAPDIYPNQHARLVMGNVTLILLCLDQICFTSAQLLKPTVSGRGIPLLALGFFLLACTLVSLYFSFQLAR
jgi:hypothetical protein